MTSYDRKPFRVLTLVFILFSVFFALAGNWLQKNGTDRNLLLAGNGIIYAATLLSAWVALRGGQGNAHAAVRALYSSFLVKFFLIIAAALLYISLNKGEQNKNGLLACAGLYILYTIIEVQLLTRMLKQKKNG